MDYSATFARHFARLVWLLMNESASVDEQKASLRALVATVKTEPVTLAAIDWQLHADETVVPLALTGVQEVLSRMRAHAVRQMRFAAGTKAADLLGLARILAADDAPANDAAMHFRGKLHALAAKMIKVEMVEPERPAEAKSFSEQVTEIRPMSETTDPSARTTRRAASPAVAPPPPGSEPARARTPAHEVMKQSPGELFAALRTSSDVDTATQVLDDLVLLAEHAMRVGKAPVVLEAFHGLVTRERDLTEGDMKRAYVMAIRRMSKPALLRVIATQIVRKSESQGDCVDVLQRMGEDGADAVIEQISHAQTSADRQQLFHVLGRLDAAVAALVRMLGDSRWFVARNAADLLGELCATDAEGSLVALLRHSDDRVRRAATNALLKLGTPEAMKAAYAALGDASPQVRMHAAAAMSDKKDSKTATTLIRAIESEQNGDVQMAMIAALGKVATPDAVQRLMRIAEPDNRVFKKKTTTLRVAAVQALGEARTPAALAALKELLADKDREVRESATRVLAHAGA
jgi:HEAT repeat protein